MPEGITTQTVVIESREVNLDIVLETPAELFNGYSYLGYHVRRLPSLSYLTFERRAMALNTANGTRELHFPPLTFLTPVQMISHVCVWPCATRRAESWVLHSAYRLEESGGKQAILYRYKRKPVKSTLVKGFGRVRVGLVTSLNWHPAQNKNTVCSSTNINRKST